MKLIIAIKIVALNSNIFVPSWLLIAWLDVFNGKWIMENGKLYRKNHFPFSIFNFPFVISCLK